MTGPRIDLMDVDRTERLGRAFHDADGTDWRLDPQDDKAVLEALGPDPGSGRPGHAPEHDRPFDGTKESPT